VLASTAEAKHPEQEQQDHRAHERDHHSGDYRVPADLKLDTENLRQHPADECAQNSGDEVSQKTEAVPKRHPAGQGSGDQTDQDPDEDRVDVEADVNQFSDSF